jgi:hypothetical protein
MYILKNCSVHIFGKWGGWIDICGDPHIYNNFRGNVIGGAMLLVGQCYWWGNVIGGWWHAYDLRGKLAAGFLAEKAQVWALLLETEVVTEGFEVRLVEY